MNSKSTVNILLVDDDPANLLALDAVLEDLGANLIHARSGADALRQALATDFAVILLDFYMPIMGGFEVAEIIRTRSPSTPIIFITASGPNEFPIEEAYSLGAVDYLAKPYNPIVLRSKVAFFIELHKRTEALALSERARYLSELNIKEGRIRLILENARGYSFIVTDLTGKITEWEGAAQTVTGWLPEEVIGQSIAIIFTDEDRLAGVPLSELTKAKKMGISEDKRWHITKNGNRFYADGVTVPLKDAADQLHGFTKIFRNATREQLASEEALAGVARLQESRALFSLLLDSSGEGIYGMDVDTKCTFLNATGAAMLGYKPEELLGRPIHDFIHHNHANGSDYPLEESRIGKAANDGVSLRVDDGVFWHKDGTAIAVSYSVSPIKAQGKPAGAVITFSDVTERRHNEKERERLIREIREADRRKSEFLATLAHELRNPLAPIKHGLEILRRSNINLSPIQKTQEMMMRQVNHMVHLVDDLLDIARINGGKIDLKIEAVQFNEILSTAIETSLPLIEAGQHELVVNISEKPIIVAVDSNRIAQVISNLLNNSAKYTPQGGRIELSVVENGQEAILSVQDSGVGIPEDAIATIFEMFNQVGRNLNRAQGGLGIGLSLVRQLVEMHGGTVTAANNKDTGSTFTVILPISQPNDNLISDESIEKIIAAVPVLRVMVVDDNVDAAETLSNLLELNGNILQTAHNGYDALQTLSGFKPHLIFLDIGMPGMDGYETAAAIRKIEGTESITLVALTGWGTAVDRAKSTEAGFNYHLTKPASLDDIDAIIAEIISANNLHTNINP